MKRTRTLAAAILALSLLVGTLWTSVVAAGGSMPSQTGNQVQVTMLTPQTGDSAGLHGFGWIIDLRLEYNATLDQTGFDGFQLTGPGAHTNAPPFAGAFSPGRDEKLPGLVVLVSTTSVGAGAGQNIANLFNIVGVTDLDNSLPLAELWDTWIVGAPSFGVNTQSVAYTAVVRDLNGDGVFNDAPNVVPDANGDGVIDDVDLTALGLASNIAKATFFINP